ncbi:hypothetical protein M9458_036717, partial [Cirrhinus mrigala]
SKPYRKMTWGERDKNKPHKTILMAGETGTGKTTLINVMINYMLGVKREDKVWFEITDDQSDRTSAQSQTSIITVYEFYLQESPIHLTIIDTPGYGNTHGINLDKEINMSLSELRKFEDWIHEIDTVCLVIMAHQNRLSDRQIYIFDAVQSLFGSDIAENIVLLLTHSTGYPPKNALTAVKEAKIKCAVNDKNQPVFFLFDNCHKKDVEDNKNFEYEVEVTYKVKVDTDPNLANMAMCCTVCEENCHYPGCWWASDLSHCSVMKDDHCTVCTKKCHYSKHVKAAKIYETKTKKEKRTFEDLKKKYDEKIRHGESLVKKMEEELQELEKEKIKLVIEAFNCVKTLQMIALNTDS